MSKDTCAVPHGSAGPPSSVAPPVYCWINLTRPELEQILAVLSDVSADSERRGFPGRARHLRQTIRRLADEAPQDWRLYEYKLPEPQ